MSDDKKPADEKTGEKSGGGKSRALVIGVVVLLVAVASSVGGAVLAPKLMGAPHEAAKPKPKHDAEESEEEEVETPIFHTLSLDSMIVDVRSDEGDFHHLKISVALEIKAKVPEEELKGFVPRARDAELTYLRTLTPADVMSSQRFATIRKELSERIIKAVGKKFVKKILITDFVVQ